MRDDDGACAIGAALAVACDDPEVLARLAGPLGEAARAAHAALGGGPVGERRAVRAAWAARVRAPLPPGLRGADPSWIEAGLIDAFATSTTGTAPGRAAARDAVARGATDPTSVWLARRALAAVPPLPAITPALVAPRSLAEAVRLAPGALRAWLEAIGLDQLAFALGPHAAAAQPVVGARLAVAAARIAQAPRHAALGPRRAAIARARIALDDTALIRIGARALAPHADGLARRQLAVRLPHALGRSVLAELREHAATPLADAPGWPALAAT